MNKYLIALPSFWGDPGFCHQTILVSAKSELDAISLVNYLEPGRKIGEIKKVSQSRGCKK